ncbi:MAG: hypothetical protein K2W82_16615 [Candidatus Obscuribacterales bacterium]|nr:hypothetical protein [Candidatus Obscuribacterales bacterium]
MNALASRIAQFIRTVVFVCALIVCYGVLIALAVAAGGGALLAIQEGESAGVLLTAFGLLSVMPMICAQNKKQLLFRAVVPGALFWCLPVCAVEYLWHGNNISGSIFAFIHGAFSFLI